MEFIYQNDFQSNSVKMYLKTNRGDATYIIGQKDGILVEQMLNRLTPLQDPLMPMLEMSGTYAKDFVQAVCDYASNKGVKTENENLLAGKLLATEKHLEDLRIYFTKVLDKVVAA